VRSDDHAETAWAPVGPTPVVASTGDRLGVNLIQPSPPRQIAVCRLRRLPERGRVHRLLPSAAARCLGSGVLVLDSHPVHRSNAVKAFAASTGGRLRPWFLPGYSPELNPNEWMWKHVKHDQSACLHSPWQADSGCRPGSRRGTPPTPRRLPGRSPSTCTATARRRQVLLARGPRPSGMSSPPARMTRMRSGLTIALRRAPPMAGKLR
jgi:hypothetical protein